MNNFIHKYFLASITLVVLIFLGGNAFAEELLLNNFPDNAVFYVEAKNINEIVNDFKNSNAIKLLQEVQMSSGKDNDILKNIENLQNNPLFPILSNKVAMGFFANKKTRFDFLSLITLSNEGKESFNKLLEQQVNSGALNVVKEYSVNNYNCTILKGNKGLFENIYIGENNNTLCSSSNEELFKYIVENNNTNNLSLLSENNFFQTVLDNAPENYSAVAFLNLTLIKDNILKNFNQLHKQENFITSMLKSKIASMKHIASFITYNNKQLELKLFAESQNAGNDILIPGNPAIVPNIVSENTLGLLSATYNSKELINSINEFAKSKLNEKYFDFKNALSLAMGGIDFENDLPELIAGNSYVICDTIPLMLREDVDEISFPTVSILTKINNDNSKKTTQFKASLNSIAGIASFAALSNSPKNTSLETISYRNYSIHTLLIHKQNVQNKIQPSFCIFNDYIIVSSHRNAIKKLIDRLLDNPPKISLIDTKYPLSIFVNFKSIANVLSSYSQIFSNNNLPTKKMELLVKLVNEFESLNMKIESLSPNISQTSLLIHY